MNWMSTTEAAAYAKRHRNTVCLAAQMGELKGYQRKAPYGRWSFLREDLDRWIRGE